jgi:cyanophycinase
LRCFLKFVYTAEFDSAYSIESLRDPYNKYIQIGADFLPDDYLLSLITDTHFAQRDRMGRLVTFVSRLSADSWASMPPNMNSSFANCYDLRYGARGVGVDEATALLIDSDFTTSIVSWDPKGSAYLLCLDHLPETCTPGEPLDVSDISVVRLTGNVTNCFNWKNWEVLDNLASSVYSLSVANGFLSSTQTNGNIY